MIDDGIEQPSHVSVPRQATWHKKAVKRQKACAPTPQSKGREAMSTTLKMSLSVETNPLN